MELTKFSNFSLASLNKVLISQFSKFLPGFVGERPCFQCFFDIFCIGDSQKCNVIVSHSVFGF